jgi:hypothetical protein
MPIELPEIIFTFCSEKYFTKQFFRKRPCRIEAESPERAKAFTQPDLQRKAGIQLLTKMNRCCSSQKKFIILIPALSSL